MQDQIASLKAMGVRAEAYNSHLSLEEVCSVQDLFYSILPFR